MWVIRGLSSILCFFFIVVLANCAGPPSVTEDESKKELLAEIGRLKSQVTELSNNQNSDQSGKDLLWFYETRKNNESSSRTSVQDEACGLFMNFELCINAAGPYVDRYTSGTVAKGEIKVGPGLNVPFTTVRIDGGVLSTMTVGNQKELLMELTPESKSGRLIRDDILYNFNFTSSEGEVELTRTTDGVSFTCSSIITCEWMSQ